MKECFKCGETKDLSEFYRHPDTRDGHLNKCKACTQRDVRENYIKKHDYFREWRRQHYQKPHVRKYMYESTQRARAKYPDKAKAHRDVSRALRKGTLVRQPCEMCGTTENVEAHHADYSKPLDVRWLCRYHHREVEGRILVSKAA